VIELLKTIQLRSVCEMKVSLQEFNPSHSVVNVAKSSGQGEADGLRLGIWIRQA
jgi:hypothetical protein